MSALSKLVAAAAALAGLLLVSQAAGAAVVGVAVDEVGGGAAPIAGAVFAPGAGPDGGNGLAAPAIGYFIPLGDASGTYGVAGFGQSADFGNGGGTLTMILQFSGVAAGLAGSLDIVFEDLDLIGANDPAGFAETIRILDAMDNPLTATITTIGGLVTGDASTQQLLSLALSSSLFTGSDLFLKFAFTSSFTSNGRNTAEYLITTVEQVPLPAALPMFLAGLAGLGFAFGRRKAL